MTKSKHVLAAALVAALGLTVAACGDDDDGGDDTTADTGASGDTTGSVAGTTPMTGSMTGTTPMTGDTTGSTPMTGDTAATTPASGGSTAPTGSAPSGDGTTVGLLFDITGRGDRSFNDAAAAGLDQAVEEFGVVASESTPSAEGDRAERLDGLVADGNELVIGVGFLWQAALQTAAVADPEQRFALIDAEAKDDQGTPDDFEDDQPLDNVASLLFAEEQGSFLVGAAAALKTQTDTVGFIGGVETSLIQKFEAGFVAGAEAVNPDITVLSQYLTQPPDFSGFNDPARGKEVAASMYEDDADVIYAAAGGSGLGMFEAASEAGEPGEVWGIGVDSDQYNLVDPALQPYVLTSMLKKVDVAVYETVAALVNDEFVGGPQTFDLASGGVDYSTTGGFVDDISEQLDEYKQQIIDGEIEVPTEP